MNELPHGGADYRLPKNPGFLGQNRTGAKILGFVLCLLCQSGATESLAWRFAQPDIGVSFTHSRVYAVIHGLPVYLPLCWIEWLAQYRAWFLKPTPPYSFPMHVAAGLGMAGGFIWLFLSSGRSLNSRAKELSKDQEDIYGSSRWADRATLQAIGLLKEKPKGLILGAWQEKPGAPLEYLYDDSDKHVLVSAPTGTGKTASVGILNALLWPGSLFCLDIKEEIYQAVAGYRQRRGHVCLKFAPLDPENGSVRINPLAWIRFGTRKEIADVQKLAEGLADPGDEGADSKHWNQTSASLMDGVILHESYKCKLLYRRAPTFADISNSLSPYEDTFEEYLKEMASTEHDPEGRMHWKNPDGTPTRIHPVVREKAMEAIQRDPKEAFSVLSTAKKRFRIYSDPLLQEATSACDFDIEDVVDHEKPVSLFFVLPPSEKERLAPLVRIVLLMILGRLTEEQKRRRHELLLQLDEFPTLGYMQPMETAPSYLRGYGIRLMPIIQDYSQITSPKRYGPKNELIPNMQIRIHFTVADLDTAKAVSEQCGSQTVQHAAIQFAPKGKTHNGPVQASSAHVQNTKRALIEPEELMRLKLAARDPDDQKKVTAPGEFVMFVFGHMPIKGLQAFWFLDPTFKKWVGLPIQDQSKALVKRDFVKEAFSA